MTIDGDTSGDKYDPANPTTEESTEDVGTADELKVGGFPRYVILISLVAFLFISLDLVTHQYHLVQSTYTFGLSGVMFPLSVKVA